MALNAFSLISSCAMDEENPMVGLEPEKASTESTPAFESTTSEGEPWLSLAKDREAALAAVL